MKIVRSGKGRSNAGISLIECLAYIALMVVILAFASRVFFEAWDNSIALRRNANDIVLALHAGDRWRADVRQASGPVQLMESNQQPQLRIPTTNGEVLYTVSNGQLLRRGAGDSTDRVWLANVKTSQMQSESRSNATIWRWELELKGGKKRAFFKPLFTFETVAQNVMPK